LLPLPQSFTYIQGSNLCPTLINLTHVPVTLLFIQHLSPYFQLLLHLSRKESSCRAMNGLVAEPPSKGEMMGTPMTSPVASTQFPCFPVNFPYDTVNSMWPSTLLFTSKLSEFLNPGIIMFGSDNSLLLGAVLCIMNVQQHP